ncbi:MAG: molybdopterin molybdotransferase MoeA [Bacteriovoracaceae bacterium]
MIGIDSALKLILENSSVLEETENLSIDEATGNILRENVFADRDLPPFNRSMMDGYAFHSNYLDVTEKCKVVGEIFPGEAPSAQFILKQNEVIRIFTGAAVPHFCDTVIQHEWFLKVNDTIFLQEGKVVKKGANIHNQGSDAKKGEVLIKEGTLITARHLPTLLSTGHNEVRVALKPKISIVTTGNEVVKPFEQPGPTQIRDANLVTLNEMAKPWAESIELIGPISDDPQKLKEALKRALNSNIVIVSAGVSAGDHDFVPDVLADLGVEKVFHKIDLKPGHPLWFGRKGQTLVFGLPGNPVSGQVCFKLMIEPLLKKILGMTNYNHQLLTLPLIESFNKKHHRHEWAMGVLEHTSEGTKILPLKNTGSGDFFHYGKAMGLISLPGKEKIFVPGERVDWLPL